MPLDASITQGFLLTPSDSVLYVTSTRPRKSPLPLKASVSTARSHPPLRLAAIAAVQTQTQDISETTDIRQILGGNYNWKDALENWGQAIINTVSLVSQIGFI